MADALCWSVPVDDQFIQAVPLSRFFQQPSGAEALFPINIFSPKQYQPISFLLSFIFNSSVFLNLTSTIGSPVSAGKQAFYNSVHSGEIVVSWNGPSIVLKTCSLLIRQVSLLLGMLDPKSERWNQHYRHMRRRDCQ